MSLYDKAEALGITSVDRFTLTKKHHPKSTHLMAFIAEHDFRDYGNIFDWRFGGDGDNGETLMYQLDAYFEALDKEPTND